MAVMKKMNVLCHIYWFSDPFGGADWGFEKASGSCSTHSSSGSTGADMILAAGPTYTDYATVGWTAQPPQDHTINAEAR